MTRFGRKFFHRRHRHKFHHSMGKLTLADIPPGRQVYVQAFLPGLTDERRAHLLAYGIVPGHKVRILQHSPVTIVQIEHMELALEEGLARQVQVEAS
jgi:Fe2+ transport system protein FeoA